MTMKKKKLFGILLTLALVLGLMPGMGLTAYAAWDGDPYANLLNTTNVVKFDGKDWYLIEDNSTALSAGTVTLLAKECVAASQYNTSRFVEYSNNPTVKSAVDTYYNSISESGKTAVDGNGMILLTKDQANAITNADVRKCQQFTGTISNGWWLCSQGNLSYKAAYVHGGSGDVDVNGYDVAVALGVRPALKLNLSSVILSSVNLSGGANTTASGESSIKNTFFLNDSVPEMTTVTYTASEGYTFPKSSDLYKITNGITVTRTNDTVVTVSGTPSGVANVTIPDAIPVYNVTYKVVGGTWSDGTTADKTETVQSGSTIAAVPTGMKAKSGYTGGAWDKNPAEVTITGDTTFTYTFTKKQAETNSLYRIYNPNSGEHFFTTSAAEKNNLVKIGWRYEGVAWSAPKSGTPVLRLYNPNAGDHHYTTSTAEKNNLVKVGWRYEGVAFYSGGSKPIYRAYNPNAVSGAHHFTISLKEKNNIVKAGWRYEGVGFYTN